MLSLLFSAVIKAQAQLPPVYNITTDTLYRQDIDSRYWQILEDKGGRWTIDEVCSQPLSDKFYQKGTRPTTADTLVSTNWFRFRIKNTMAANASFSFYTGSQQSDFYIFGNGSKALHFVTGDGYPWSKKDGLKKANAIPFRLQPGETVTVYQRRYNEVPANISGTLKIGLLGTEKLKEAELKDYQDNYVKNSSIYLSSLPPNLPDKERD